MSVDMNSELRAKRIEFQKEIIATGVWQSCLNCSQFTEAEQCQLFKARPPAHIIVNGCKDHLSDCPF